MLLGGDALRQKEASVAARIVSVIALVSLLLAGTMPVAVARAKAFPETVSLPDGFYPEGIAVGRGHDFYVGSLLNGALYKGDLRTGDGSVLAPGVTGVGVQTG